MKRYIKVKGEWIDTKAEHDEWGRYYRVERNTENEDEVWYWEDEYGLDYKVGILQDQTDDTKKLASEYRRLWHYSTHLKEGGKAWERVMKQLDNIQGVVMYERKN